MVYAFAGLHGVMRNVQHMKHAARRVATVRDRPKRVCRDLVFRRLTSTDESEHSVMVKDLPARRVIDVADFYLMR